MTMSMKKSRSMSVTKRMTLLKPSAKLWLKKGELSVIGAGRARLLRAISEHGSISKAASATGMSYRHAWGIVKQIRNSIGTEIILTSRGGTQDGGTRLTEIGIKILEQFECYEKEIDRILKYGRQPALAVDGVIFNNEGLVLISRKNPPYAGKLALPGGFVKYNETTEVAVKREVHEELGIKTEIKQLLGVYSNPTRDPRHHTISVVYELDPLSTKFQAGDDAASFKIISLDDIERLSNLAFDHSEIVNDALKKVRNR